MLVTNVRGAWSRACSLHIVTTRSTIVKSKWTGALVIPYRVSTVTVEKHESESDLGLSSQRTAATERGVLGMNRRRKEEGGVSRRLVQREEREEVGEGMYDTKRYDTEVYLPSFPLVPVNDIPKKYRPIPNRNTDSGCNSS